MGAVAAIASNELPRLRLVALGAALLVVAGLAALPRPALAQSATPPASDGDAPKPKAPPKAVPLDSWDEEGNEKGRKREDAPPAGIVPGSGKDYTPRLKALRASRHKTSIDQEKRAMRRAKASTKEHDFGQKFVVGLGGVWRNLPGDLDVGTVAFGSPPAAADGVGATLRLGFNPGSAFSIQAEGLYQPSRFDGVDGDATFIALRGVMLLYLPLGRVRLFILASGGAEWLSNDVGPIKADVDLSIGAGAGVQFEFNPWIGIRGDGRIVGTDGRNGMARIVEFSLGVEFRFMPSVD